MVQHADIDHTGLTGVGVGDATAHIADTTDAHDASAISVLDSGANFTGTDVEAVLAELQDNIDAVGAGSFDEDLLPWTITLVPFASITHTNFDTLTADGSTVMGGRVQSSGAQNDEIAWDIVLAAGTWRVDLLMTKAANTGIYHVRFDGTDKGTIDSYAGVTGFNQRGAVTGITVATSAKIRLALKMASKNASSSSYFGLLSLVTVMRTA